MLPEAHQLIRAAVETYAAGSVATRRSVREIQRRLRPARRTAPPLGSRDAAALRGQRLRSDRSWLDLTGDGSPKRRLLMVHIPKTGGTSLRRMLAEHVQADRVFLSTGAFEWADESVRSLSQYELFVGHVFLEPLYLLPDSQWTTTLTVREPGAWWQSMYSARRARAQREGDSEHPTARYSMGHWLDTRRDEQISNGQTSWLLARTRVMFDSRFARPRLIAGFASVLADQPSQVLELLDDLLDRVTVVGVTEDLQQAYVQTCLAHGWRPAHGTVARDNVSPHDAEQVQLTGPQRERLHELNRLDHYLYERALDRHRQDGGPGRPAVVDVAEPVTAPRTSGTGHR